MAVGVCIDEGWMLWRPPAHGPAKVVAVETTLAWSTWGPLGNRRNRLEQGERSKKTNPSKVVSPLRVPSPYPEGAVYPFGPVAHGESFGKKWVTKAQLVFPERGGLWQK